MVDRPYEWHVVWCQPDLVKQCPEFNFGRESALGYGQVELGCLLISGVCNNRRIQYSVCAPVLHNRRDLMNVTGAHNDHVCGVVCRVSGRL